MKHIYLLLTLLIAAGHISISCPPGKLFDRMTVTEADRLFQVHIEPVIFIPSGYYYEVNRGYGIYDMVGDTVVCTPKFDKDFKPLNPADSTVETLQRVFVPAEGDTILNISDFSWDLGGIIYVLSHPYDPYIVNPDYTRDADVVISDLLTKEPVTVYIPDNDSTGSLAMYYKYYSYKEGLYNTGTFLYYDPKTGRTCVGDIEREEKAKKGKGMIRRYVDLTPRYEIYRRGETIVREDLPVGKPIRLSTEHADNTFGAYMPIRLIYTAPDKTRITFTPARDSTKEPR